MAKKKIKISEEQLLITDEGEIIKAKALLHHKYNLLQWTDTYHSASISNIVQSKEDLVLIGGAQGRTIRCSADTKFLPLTSEPDTKEIDYTLKGSENSALVSRYLPLYGSIHLSEKEIDYIKSSISNIQGKRPNSYLVQRIPLYLSKLNEVSLRKIIKYIFKSKRVQHLDQDSKDLLIMLLSRLGIYFDGQTKHKSTNITGTIELIKSMTNISTKPTKKESIRFIKSYTDNALELTFKDSGCFLIGSFLCPIA